MKPLRVGTSPALAALVGLAWLVTMSTGCGARPLVAGRNHPPDAASDAASDRPSLGDGAADDPLPQNVDVSTPFGFCVALFRARGAYQSRCWGQAPSHIDHIAAEDCLGFVLDVAAGRTGFDPGKVAACLRSWEETRCALEGQPPPVVCDAITPLVPGGGACHREALADCAGGGSCQPDPNSCDGHCVTYLPEGADCSPVNVDCRGGRCCGSGLVCAQDGHCRVWVGASQGEDCSGGCRVGLYCEPDRDAGDFGGTCQMPKTSGPCHDILGCAPGMACVGPPGAKVCAVRKMNGQPCTPGNDECQYLTHCTAQRTCSALLAQVGEACDQFGGDTLATCAWGLRCSGGMPSLCYTPHPPGGRCANDSDCGDHDAFCDLTNKVCVSC